MKLEIKTATLSDMLGKAQKGVGNNKLLPITSFLHLQEKDRTLTITATDINNYINVIEKNVVGEDGEVIVPADQFMKLVSRTTVETIKMELKEDHLAVKGNGNYKIPVLNEEYPEYEFDDSVEGKVISTAQLKNIFTVNKASLATDMTMPCLTGFNLGDKAITTDGVKMCINEVKVLDEPVLLTQELANLLSTLTAEKVMVKHSDGKLLFTSDNIVVFGAELAGIEDYPDLNNILAFEYPSKCKLSKVAISNVLDRLNIFVSPYDNNGVVLTFTKEGLMLTDVKGENTELVPYLSSENFADYMGTVNITLLSALINAIQADTFELYYGNDTVIKLKDGAVTEILCLMGGDDE